MSLLAKIEGVASEGMPEDDISAALARIAGEEKKEPPKTAGSSTPTAETKASSESKPAVKIVKIASAEFNLTDIANKLETLKARDWCKRLISRLDKKGLDELEFNILSIIDTTAEEDAAIDHILSTIEARRVELSHPSPTGEVIHVASGDEGTKPSETATTPETGASLIKLAPPQNAISYLRGLVDYEKSKSGSSRFSDIDLSEIETGIENLKNLTSGDQKSKIRTEIAKLLREKEVDFSEQFERQIFES